MSVRVKICGLSTPADIDACARAGAAYVGFMFFEKSPRNLSIAAAQALAVEVPVGLAKVAVTVNASEAFMDELVDTVPLDMLQLHGSESAECVIKIKERYGLPVMKVVGIADESDLASIDDYSRVADQILVETKPAKDAKLPGGNGIAFDWRLVAGRKWSVPWMLAGGLSIDNVADAIAQSGATQVDISSGVETAPGVKDAARIKRFVAAAKGA